MAISDDECLDIRTPLHPLSHYIGDETELVSQMFSAIRGAKLDAMMPQSLKVNVNLSLLN